MSDETPQTVPNKRGRKPKVKPIEDTETKVPKKRGRKPKPKDPNAVEKEYMPKKRGRKPKDQTQTDQDTLNKNRMFQHGESIDDDIDRTITNDLILYLPNISSDDLKLINFSSSINTNPTETNDINALFNKATSKQNKEYETNDNGPQAYNSSNKSSANFYQLPTAPVASVSTTSIATSSVQNYDIPKNYDTDNKDRWIKNTSTKCYHCTYNFDTMPCAIPYKYIKGIYQVYGCFCSFECAYKYLLNNKIHKKQEVISLLHSLNKHFYNHEKTIPIIPAPNKEVLIDYGGNITIEEFRKNNVSKENQYNICIPPLVPINHTVETIKNNITNSGIKNKTKTTTLYDMMTS